MWKRLLVSVTLVAVGWTALDVWRLAALPTFHEKSDPQLGGIVEGVATRDALFLRHYSGNLTRIDRATGERSNPAQDVIDILIDGPHIWALTPTTEGAWQVLDLRNTNNASRVIPVEGTLRGLFKTSTGLAVLTSTTAMLPSATGWTAVTLDEIIRERAEVLSPSDQSLYVGYDDGEFGGGLRQIDLTNGQVTNIDDSQPDQLCSGLINSSCDPVVGLVEAPDGSDCILTAIALSHLGMHYGRVVSACGQSLAFVYARDLWTPIVTVGRLLGGEGDTWAFNDLVAAPNGWVATGSNLYARASYSDNNTNPKVKTSSYPRLKSLGGLKVSREIDGIIFAEDFCCVSYGPITERIMVALPVLQ